MPAEPHSYSPALVGTLQRSVVVGMGLHRFFHLPDAHPGQGDAGRHSVALLKDILQTKIQGVHAQLFSKFVDDRFDSEATLGLARGPVGLDFLLVANYVIAVHCQVLYVVGCSGRHCAAANRGPGVGPCFIG